MKSIWTETKMPKFPELHAQLKTDVLVIGGGMAGLLCAHQLQDSGAQVVLVEAGRICGGVTASTTAKITAHHGLIYHKLLQKLGTERAKLYLEANEEAVARFYRLCKEIPCHFESQANFVYSLNDRQILEQETHALHRLGCGVSLKEELPLPFRTAGAVKMKRQAQFHPLEFAAHIANKLRIFENTTVRELKNGVAVTDFGEIAADSIVIATHFPMLNKHGFYFLKMYQQRSYVLGLENTDFPGGMFIGSEENSLSFRRSGELLLLGGGGHRTGARGGGWRELWDFAQTAYPQAVEVSRWATQDCMTLDAMPYIGQYSRRTPNLYVATGFNKWGMTGSMVASTLLRDLILGRQSPYEALFSPSRGMNVPRLSANLLHATGNLLRPTRPRCPHMGCALRWNPVERSWDCNCHGSRFAENGKLLDNPAQDDLPL